VNINIIIDYLIISAVVSLATNLIARNIAQSNNILVDLPDRSRKFHKRPTPLTGGIGILLGLLLSGKIYLDLNELNDFMPIFTSNLIIASGLLVLFFLMDDLYDIRAKYRLLAQCLFSYFIIHTTGVSIESFGNLLGFGEIELGIMSIPVTIFCVIGVMNAFNMIDGINGLCAGSALIMMLYTGFSSNLIYDSMLILLVGSMLGFLTFNLRIIGKQRTVFLGDHGSNFIGFIVAWIAIYATQNQTYDMNPITAVWFIAIPLLDCIALIISRTRRGVNWAKPGRDHIHHRLMLKYSPEMTLLIIILISSILCIFAIIMENNFNEYISFYSFVCFSGFYYFLFYYFIRTKRLSSADV
jgi:UDP-GlcNAc:undecaprenyl-phosphate GlcNAc-1-phosphate transferase